MRRRDLRAGHYGQAKAFYGRVLLVEFGRYQLVARARRGLAAADQGLIPAQVATIRDGETHNLGRPVAEGGTGSAEAEVTIANSAPYPLELLLSGPEAQRVSIPACTSCEKYSSGSQPDTCAAVPTDHQHQSGHLFGGPQVAEGIHGHTGGC